MSTHSNATQHDGPFCSDPACPVCDLFERPGETYEQFVARLIATYSRISFDSYDHDRRVLAARKRWHS